MALGQNIDVSWYVPGRVLYGAGSLDRDQMLARNRQFLEVMQAEGQPPQVHFLIDHNGRYTPRDLLRPPHLMHYYINLGDDEIREKLVTHPLCGWVMSIGTPTTALKMAGAATSKRHQYQWKTVKTLDEALAFLKRQDESLRDLL